MNRPVDVLAVMENATQKLGVNWPNSQQDLREARAAVAELIDAGRAATAEVMHDGASSRAACDRLIAALARCGDAP